MDFEYTDPESGETKVWKWPGEGSYKILSQIYSTVYLMLTLECKCPFSVSLTVIFLRIRTIFASRTS